MHADHVLRTARSRGDLVDVEVGGVRRQDGARLGDAVELAEDLLLELHVLEHGFDDQVALGERFEVGAAAEQLHALVDLVHRDTAALRRALVVLAHDAEAALQRLLLSLDDVHRKSLAGEVHRDTATHRAGAENADALDGALRRVFRHVGDLACRSFCEEVVALRLRLRIGVQHCRELRLFFQSLIEGQCRRGFDALDASLGSGEAARLARHFAPEIGKQLGVLTQRVAVRFDVAQPAQRRTVVDELASEGDGVGLERVFADERVENAELDRFGGRNVPSADDQVESALETDEPRHALRASSRRKNAELDLGQTDFCRRHGDAVVAAHRRFESASERGAVNRGDEGLLQGLHLQTDVVGVGRQARLAELFDVGSRDERPALAQQYDGTDGVVADEMFESLLQPLAHVLALGVDRRVVDPEEADSLAVLERDGLTEGFHGSLGSLAFSGGASWGRGLLRRAAYRDHGSWSLDCGW